MSSFISYLFPEQPPAVASRMEHPVRDNQTTDQRSLTNRIYNYLFGPQREVSTKPSLFQLTEIIITAYSIESADLIQATTTYFNEDHSRFTCPGDLNETNYIQDFITSAVIRTLGNCTIGEKLLPKSGFVPPDINALGDIEKNTFVKTLEESVADHSEIDWMDAAMKFFCANSYAPDITAMSGLLCDLPENMLINIRVMEDKEFTLNPIRNSEGFITHLSASLEASLEFNDISQAAPTPLTKANFKKTFTIHRDMDKNEWVIRDLDLTVHFIPPSIIESDSLI